MLPSACGIFHSPRGQNTFFWIEWNNTMRLELFVTKHLNTFAVLERRWYRVFPPPFGQMSKSLPLMLSKSREANRKKVRSGMSEEIEAIEQLLDNFILEIEAKKRRETDKATEWESRFVSAGAQIHISAFTLHWKISALGAVDLHLKSITEPTPWTDESNALRWSKIINARRKKENWKEVECSWIYAKRVERKRNVTVSTPASSLQNSSSFQFHFALSKHKCYPEFIHFSSFSKGSENWSNIWPLRYMQELRLSIITKAVHGRPIDVCCTLRLRA